MEGFESDRQDNARVSQQLDWIYLSRLRAELTDGDSGLITNKRFCRITWTFNACPELNAMKYVEEKRQMLHLPTDYRQTRVNSYTLQSGSLWKFSYFFPSGSSKQQSRLIQQLWIIGREFFLAFPIPVMKLSSVKRNHSCKTLKTDHCRDNFLMNLSTQNQRVTHLTWWILSINRRTAGPAVTLIIWSYEKIMGEKLSQQPHLDKRASLD